MYLQKLEIQGFKSFATKTTLEFNRQLTAVVGPNGSGKSNIADAIRWVLGEQSLKLLRGKRAEDVIFAGSDLKGRLGMAEVSLYLNNEDGSAAVDFSEIVITRRVFRDGQSEYLLNGSPVRLQDIQLLLAQANFGQKTYSVIGQGMIDSILMASSAERKEFFEEATGVKQYQLKREQAIQKLASTYDNLEQGQAVLQEIEPRLRALTRQVKRLERREELERELREIQKGYYRFRWHELDKRRSSITEHESALQQQLTTQRQASAKLQATLKQLEGAELVSQSWHTLQQRQTELRSKLASLVKEEALAQVAEEVEHLKRGEGETAWLKQRQHELEVELKQLAQRTSALTQEREQQQHNLQKKIEAQEHLVTEFEHTNAGSGDAWIQQELEAVAGEHSEVRRELAAVKALTQLPSLVSRIASLEERLRGLAKRLVRRGANPSKELNETLAARESVVRERAVLEATLSSLEREQTALDTARTQLAASLEKIGQALSGKGGTKGKAQAGEIKALVESTEAELAKVEKELGSFQMQAESKKSEFFATQKALTSATETERRLEREFGEVQVESARVETKLEDLEREMAQEVPPELMHQIKETGKVEPIDEGTIALELQKLKHQLELTGGIEPEVVSEYQQTKTRFDFLTAQVTDLQSAIASLESVIRDLDGIIEKRFLVSFKAINEKFISYFKVLFTGGRAELLLQRATTEEAKADEVEGEVQTEAGEEPPQLSPRQKFLQQERVKSFLFSGVEIHATPPGKKLSSITALSGGERALTSIALICAIIANNPSPFVALDEVDAALDEANSERFAAILDALMSHTQFITITHNRATMRRASILYGVTMGEDGVSKLLSVKFDQADELAAAPKPTGKAKK